MKLLSLFTLSAFGQGWNQQAVPISAPAPQQQGMNPMMMSLLLGKDSSIDPMTRMLMMGGGQVLVFILNRLYLLSQYTHIHQVKPWSSVIGPCILPQPNFSSLLTKSLKHDPPLIVL